jgi:hypothetical protein
MRFHYLRHTGTSASGELVASNSLKRASQLTPVAAGYGCDNANDYNYTSADFDASYGL